MRSINRILKTICLVGLLSSSGISASGSAGSDTIVIHSVGHASLFFEYKDLIIHVDPYSAQADYNSLPDANLIFITHEHSDHYDPSALNKSKTDSTILICPQSVKKLGTFSGTTTVLNNGDSAVFKGIPVIAVPAYNVTSSWHTKGVGNGYVFTFGEKRVYVAGDTENIPEMGNLGKIDIAFLPMNLPYTMTPTAAAAAAKIIKPDVLYIYHFGTSDTASLRKLLIDQKMTIRMGKSIYSESDKRAEISSSVHPNTESDVSFYPNPVLDFLTIYNLDPGSSVSLYNLSGQLLIQKQQQFKVENRLDLKSLMPGMYVMRYQDKQLIKSSLILKE